jgi:hypothetical protein
MLKMRGKRPVWTSAIYLQDKLTLPPVGAPEAVVSCRAGLRLPSAPHTKADPFIFEFEERLFLFVETQALDDPGQIEVMEIGTGGDSLKVILKEPFHVSYPHVFEIDGEIYMLPETAAANEVRLYKFTDFPLGLRYHRTLLTGNYTDPSPVLIDGIWYVFMTSQRGLELFYTSSLLTSELSEHPASPITADPRYCRSAGVPFFRDGDLLRPAQDCSERYGGNVNLLRVAAISQSEYQESPIENHLLNGDQAWSEQGGHHVSVCQRANGSYAVAIDGQAADSLVNKITARIWMKLFRRPA